MSLTQSLEKLVDIWESKGVPMRQHLRPGLTRVEIQAALTPLGLNPPEELYELYEWHDGVDDYYKPALMFGEHQFIPLNDAIKELQGTIEYYIPAMGDEYDASPDLAKCLPFGFFDGSSYGVYCDPALVEGLQYPVIRIFEGDEVEFENLNLMAETVLEWFRCGVYGNDNSVDDDELRWAIREKLNPRVQYGGPSYNLQS